MVDIHSHILPGLDDGAKTLDESIAMLKMAAESGTTCMVATPHASMQYKFDPEAVAQRAAEVAARVPEVRVVTGCDFHLSFENIQDALRNPRKYTINGTQYLLVEFPDMIAFSTTPQIFAELRRAGMLPIITHPERNAFLQERTDEMARWVEDGAFVQVTAQSLLGLFGRKARDSAHALLKAGIVHFIASDAHDLEHRTTPLRESFEYVAGKFGQETAERLFVENPSAVVAGEPITELTPARAVRPWYKFWA